MSTPTTGIQHIDSLPNPPNRGQSAETFSTNADSFLSKLPTFGTQLNLFADQVNALGIDGAAASAQQARSSATAAAASATNAADSFNSLDKRYLGAKATAPTTDSSGGALVAGAQYFNTTDNNMYVYSGSVWKITTSTAGKTISSILATANQTVVTTPSYVVGNNSLEVYVNGIRMTIPADYSETSTTSITFVKALKANDEVLMIASTSYSLGSTSASNVSYGSGNVQGALDALNLADYSVLRSYTGTTTNVYIVASGIAGNFKYDSSDTTSTDNGGTIIVSSNGKRWKRQYSGYISVFWFGAKGDGVTDDYQAIQAAITVAFVNNIGTVMLPSGTFNVSKPLYLYGSDNYIRAGVRLVGAGVKATTIKKTGNGTTSDGSWYGTIDAVLILSPYPAPVSATPTTGTYNVEFSNLTLAGFDTSPNDYGVYSKDDFGQIKSSRVCIQGTKSSFRIDGNMWLSSFENFQMNPVVHGFYMGRSGTSIFLRNTYVLGGSGVGYNLTSLYSSADSIACDGFTGTPYQFSFAQWTINGLGCESAGASNAAIVCINNSQVEIDSALFFSPSVFQVAAGTKLQVNKAFVGYDKPAARSGYLWFVGGTGQLCLKDCNIVDTFSTPNTGYASTITSSVSGQGSFGVNALTFPANTPNSGMTSIQMKWYEEGNWTPIDTGVTSGVLSTWTVSSAKYTRIGRLVTVTAVFTGTAIGLTAGTGYYKFGGLPFTSADNAVGAWNGAQAFTNVQGAAFTAGDFLWLHGAQSSSTSNQIVVSVTYSV